MTLTAVSSFQTLRLPILTSNCALGTIVTQTYIWACLTVNDMLWGELLSSASMIVTWLNYHVSYHDCSVTCHVSAIRKDAHLSHRNLPDSHHRKRSDRSHIQQLRRWAWINYERRQHTRSRNDYKRILCYPALITALSRDMIHFWWLRFGSLKLYGKSLHYVLRHGLP